MKIQLSFSAAFRHVLALQFALLGCTSFAQDGRSDEQLQDEQSERLYDRPVYARSFISLAQRRLSEFDGDSIKAGELIYVEGGFLKDKTFKDLTALYYIADFSKLRAYGLKLFFGAGSDGYERLGFVRLSEAGMPYFLGNRFNAIVASADRAREINDWIQSVNSSFPGDIQIRYFPEFGIARFSAKTFRGLHRMIDEAVRTDYFTGFDWEQSDATIGAKFSKAVRIEQKNGTHKNPSISMENLRTWSKEYRLKGFFATRPSLIHSLEGTGPLYVDEDQKNNQSVVLYVFLDQKSVSNTRRIDEWLKSFVKRESIRRVVEEVNSPSRSTNSKSKRNGFVFKKVYEAVDFKSIDAVVHELSGFVEFRLTGVRELSRLRGALERDSMVASVEIVEEGFSCSHNLR